MHNGLNWWGQNILAAEDTFFRFSSHPACPSYLQENVQLAHTAFLLWCSNLKVAFFHLFVKLFTVVSVGPISALVHCYTLTNKLNIFLGLFPSKEDHIDLCTIYILIYGVSLCIDIHITICNALPQTDAATDKPFLKCILSWSPLKQCIPVCLRSSVIDSDSAPLHRPIPSPGHWRWRAWRQRKPTTSLQSNA